MNSKDFMELYDRMYQMELAHERLVEIVEELTTKVNHHLSDKSKSPRRGIDE